METRLHALGYALEYHRQFGKDSDNQAVIGTADLFLKFLENESTGSERISSWDQMPRM